MPSPATLRRTELRLDEGYSGSSEETRSLSDSDADTHMHLDPDMEMDKSQPSNEALAGHLSSLSARDRADIVVSALSSLPESERFGSYLFIRSICCFVRLTLA